MHALESVGRAQNKQSAILSLIIELHAHHFKFLNDDEKKKKKKGNDKNNEDKEIFWTVK